MSLSSQAASGTELTEEEKGVGGGRLTKLVIKNRKYERGWRSCEGNESEGTIIARLKNETEKRKEEIAEESILLSLEERRIFIEELPLAVSTGDNDNRRFARAGYHVYEGRQ